MSERVFVATRLLKVELQFQYVEVGACAVLDHGQNRIAEQFLSDSLEALRDLLRSGQCRKVEQRCKTKVRVWALILGSIAKVMRTLRIDRIVISLRSRSFTSMRV